MQGRRRGARLIAIGCALLLSAGLVVSPALEAGTFTLVPREHWAYDVLDEVTNAVEGNDSGQTAPDSTEAREGAAVGDPNEPLTRYELAIRIRQLDDEVDVSGETDIQALLDRLTAEFDAELAHLDDPASSDLLDGAPVETAIERGGASVAPRERLSPDSRRLAVVLDDIPHETLRSSLEKLSQLEADFRLGGDQRLRGELSIETETEGAANRLRGASAGLELSLSPTTTLSTAYAIGRDDAADPQHDAKFDLEYQLTAETSLRAAYRLVNFGQERRASEAEAEISIRF